MGFGHVRDSTGRRQSRRVSAEASLAPEGVKRLAIESERRGSGRRSGVAAGMGMTAETTVLRAMGGLYEANALLHCPGTPSELAELFAAAAERRVKLTLVGSQRSFGEHFLPPAGAEAVST